MKTLIFEPTLTGHHLEYLHHLYVGALGKYEQEYIFAVPQKQWYALRNKCIWKESSNITWFMLDDAECGIVQHGSLFKKSLAISHLIRRTILETRADKVFLIALSSAIPVLPFIIPQDVRISGIIYKIYLRAKISPMRKFIDRIRYSVMARCKNVKDVFILNDARSALELNKIYSTNKFIPLSDPVPELNKEKIFNLRQELGVNSDIKMFLHFGAMDSRKGTIEILNALSLISPENLSNKVFVFAGKVSENIRQKFYSQVDYARRHGANIIVKDEFCEYDYLNNLCHTADCILIPYLLTDLSSGAIGYAAVHKTPVIGPAGGLIGDLIKDNNLGVVLAEITSESLADAIVNFVPIEVNSEYAIRNSINSFCSTILE